MTNKQGRGRPRKTEVNPEPKLFNKSDEPVPDYLKGADALMMDALLNSFKVVEGQLGVASKCISSELRADSMVLLTCPEVLAQERAEVIEEKLAESLGKIRRGTTNGGRSVARRQASTYFSFRDRSSDGVKRVLKEFMEKEISAHQAHIRLQGMLPQVWIPAIRTLNKWRKLAR